MKRGNVMENEKHGAALHDADAERRKEAARALGSARTEKKIAAARAVAESRRGSKWTDEQKANLREVQRIRREREQAERIANGATLPEAKEKKAIGRPKKVQSADAAIIGADSPKRGRGRPRKSEAAIETPNT